MPATIQTAVAYIVHSLQKHSDAPHLDAERIMLAVLQQQDASYLLAHTGEALEGAALRNIQHMTALRASGMPLAYVLGEADFYGRTFSVTADTLIPRPETEQLIEKALAYIQQNFSTHTTLTIADIGTGSGIVAITLALELGSTYHLVATDISPAALEVAKENAKIHGVLDRIEFIEGDMLTPFQTRVIDLIVSNPPYVPSGELQKAGDTIETRGLLFEPSLALDGGIDGQVFVQQIQASGIPAIVETTGGRIIVL